MMQSNRFGFSNEGVDVVVPGQKKKVRAIKGPMAPLANMRPGRSGFTPGRLVMNITLVDDDNPDTVLTEFDPPFEMKVRYTLADSMRAQKANRPLELAFWDGDDWVRFTKEKHQFELQPDSPGSHSGYGVVKISRWGDPPVGWGP